MSKKSSGTYKMTVIFSRSLSDDLEVVRSKFRGCSLAAKLQRQLAEELQQAYDSTAMAGHFQVNKPAKVSA